MGSGEAPGGRREVRLGRPLGSTTAKPGGGAGAEQSRASDGAAEQGRKQSQQDDDSQQKESNSSSTSGSGGSGIAQESLALRSHEAPSFPYTYRVRVSNVGSVPVQVRSRHLRFVDEDGGKVEVPRGSPGLVGHQPVLEPGKCFEYASGVRLAAPSGRMDGSFGVKHGPTGEQFEAQIAMVQFLPPPGKEQEFERMMQEAADRDAGEDVDWV